MAFSLDLLELYHRLRRRQPRLGIMPFVQSLCDIHEVCFYHFFSQLALIRRDQILYRHHYREQFSIAFDAYLAILRRVRQRVNCALGRDRPHWRILNGCPPCNFRVRDLIVFPPLVKLISSKLENEGTLIPSRLGCMDGNNSLKRFASVGTEDGRVFHSDYFLTREEADKFANEVRGRMDNQEPVVRSDRYRLCATAHYLQDAPWAPINGAATDDTSNPPIFGVQTPCTQNWHNTRKESDKTTSEILDQTGVFGGACRHEIILKFVEMWRSGEL